MIRRGDRVIVADPADEYDGQQGTVASNERLGLLSARTLVDVRLDGREPWDVEGFYTDQLVDAHSQSRYETSVDWPRREPGIASASATASSTGATREHRALRRRSSQRGAVPQLRTPAVDASTLAEVSRGSLHSERVVMQPPSSTKRSSSSARRSR
jgi:hypothetical protein